MTVEERRAARKQALAEERERQRETDLEAVDALEVELGDANVAIVEVPYVSGLVSLAAVRAPSAAEIKRYRNRVKGQNADPVAAAEELGMVCLAYPPTGEARAKLLESRVGLLVQLGVVAIHLATGKETEEGKG